MSVTSEFNLLKTPFNNKVVRLDNDRVLYYRENSLITLNFNTGESTQIKHEHMIKTVACHPNFGKSGSNFIAIAFRFGKIFVYDYETNLLTPAYQDNLSQEKQWIGLHMTADGGIVSVVGNTIVHYCSVTKKTKSGELGNKFRASEMKGTVHDPDLLAIGSNCGLVVIVSIKDLRIKQSFRGHNYSVAAIAWIKQSDLPQEEVKTKCPPRVVKQATKPTPRPVVVDDDDDCFDIYDDANFDDNFGVEKKSSATADRSTYQDEAEAVEEAPISNTNFDFVEACQTLKEEMLQKKQEQTPQPSPQVDKDECARTGHNMDGSDEDSLSSGFSNRSVASSNIEETFEKITLNDSPPELILVTMDQFLNIWTWDVTKGCSRGNCRIQSNVRDQQQSNQLSNFVILEDGRTIVGSTNTRNVFTVQLPLQTSKTIVHCQAQQNQGAVLAAVGGQRVLTYGNGSHKIKVEELVSAKEFKVVQEFPAYNSIHVKAIAVGKVNPFSIAIGTHELCFFDLVSVTDRQCKFTTYYKNLKKEIACLTWHPEMEILAFATMEGRIGLFNAQNNSVEFLKPFTGKEIYDLSFGKVGDEFRLFALCSTGVCVTYYNNYKEFQFIIRNISKITAIFVDNSAKKLFAGTQTGEVHVLDMANCNAICQFRVGRKYIRSFTLNSDNSQLMIVSKESDLFVISTAQLMAQSGQPKIVTLRGHKKPLVTASGSLKDPNLIVTTGYDFTVRTWDLRKNLSTMDDGHEMVTPLATYEFHDAALKYAIFSPLDEDCLIVGVGSNPFYVFNTKSKKENFGGKSSILFKEVKSEEPKKINISGEEKMAQTKDKKGNSGDQKKGNEATVFYLAKREVTKKAIDCLKSMMAGNEDDKESLYLHKRIFSDDVDQIRSVLAEEVKNYKSSNMRTNGTELVALMQGNVKEVIVEHLKNKSLTEEMVAISPMVSHNFWTLCMEAFAMQLIEEEQPVRAVIHLLGVQRVEDAIRVLLEKKYHREAWILAKLKKAEEDQVFDQIAKEWTEYLNVSGRFEEAAIVAIGIGDKSKALELLLNRREDQWTEEHRAVIDALKATVVKQEK